VSDHDNEFIAPPALAAAGGMRRAG